MSFLCVAVVSPAPSRLRRKVGVYQDAQEAIDTVIRPLPQEEGAPLVSQQFLVVTLHGAAAGPDVLERRDEKVAQRDELEGLGREGASVGCQGWAVGSNSGARYLA